MASNAQDFAGAGSPGGKQWILPGVLVVLAAVVVWFATKKVHYLTDVSLPSYTDYFWPRRWGLLMHLSGGAIAISTGLVQLWLGFSGRTRALHRILGRVYVFAVIVGVCGGGYLALTIPGHIAYSTGLFGLALAWFVTTAMAVYAIQRRNIAQHRAWMLRSYTVTFAFVIFRLSETWLTPWIKVSADPVATELDTLLAWACWAFPLMIAEVLIQLRTMRGGSWRG